MKISSEITKKEYSKAFNLSLNISKNIRNKRLMTMTQKIVKDIIISFILMTIISITDTFINLEWVTNSICILFLILIIYIIFKTIKLLYNYQKKKKRTNKIEIRLNKDGIIDISEENNYIARTWDEIKYILNTDQEILIICTNSQTFILPKRKEIEEKIKEALKKYSHNIPIIEKTRPQKFQKHLWNWGIYLLIFCITFGIAVFWDYYNTCLLDQEIYKINENEYQVDEKIYSYEKFGIIERTLKEYFQEFSNAKEKYEQNKAQTIFSAITIDKLKNQKQELQNMERELETKEKLANEAVEELISLLDETIAMEKIKKYHLEEYYNDIFKKYAFTEYDYYYLESWKKELEINKEHMKLLKRAFEILNQENCWYIEDDKLYMCEENREEYNNIYKEILKENGIKM